MYPHHIRLRGPWECEPIALVASPPSKGAANQARRVTIPCRWADAGLAGFRGQVRFNRKFGYPGKADRDIEHIWLTCAGCTDVRAVHLNGQLLPAFAGAQFAFDVTSIMAERNHLEVLIDGSSDDAGLWGEVAMEIRMDAYLADVRIDRTPASACLSGRVVGVAPQPLELYTLVDGRHVDYRTISPRPDGEPFHIDLASIPSLNAIVRVELINVSTIWYSIETSITHWNSA